MKLKSYTEELFSIFLEKDSDLEVHNDHVLIIGKESSVEKKVKFADIRRIVFLGNNSNVKFSTLYKLARRGISIDILDHKALPLGQILACSDCFDFKNYVKQEKLVNRPESLEISKQLILAKVLNSFSVISRKIAIRRKIIAGLIDRISQTATKEELRGAEGISSRMYFSYWKELLKNKFPWYGRFYHPEKDPVNIMLSMGYSFLYTRMSSSLAAYGLNPRLGIMHSSRGKHCALASDFMEPFRAFVDSTVLRLIRRQEVRIDQFRENNGQFSIGDSACYKTVISAFEEMFNAETVLYKSGDTNGIKRTLNSHIDNLACSFAEYLRHEDIDALYAMRLVKWEDL